ncbi:hypothetical protein LXL04_037762 [Taraxacum kok-saghyz]
MHTIPEAAWRRFSWARVGAATKNNKAFDWVQPFSCFSISLLLFLPLSSSLLHHEGHHHGVYHGRWVEDNGDEVEGYHELARGDHSDMNRHCSPIFFSPRDNPSGFSIISSGTDLSLRRGCDLTEFEEKVQVSEPVPEEKNVHRSGSSSSSSMVVSEMRVKSEELNIRR